MKLFSIISVGENKTISSQTDKDQQRSTGSRKDQRDRGKINQPIDNKNLNQSQNFSKTNLASFSI
jgi:hypothetical protein